jgi:hypothetical protein
MPRRHISAQKNISSRDLSEEDTGLECEDQVCEDSDEELGIEDDSSSDETTQQVVLRLVRAVEPNTIKAYSFWAVRLRSLAGSTFYQSNTNAPTKTTCATSPDRV